MEGQIKTVALNKNFEDIKKTDQNGVEFWEARELMPVLGYPNWQKSEEVTARAAKTCLNSGQNVDNHFNQLVKMVKSVQMQLGRRILDKRIQIAYNCMQIEYFLCCRILPKIKHGCWRYFFTTRPSPIT
jgi:hypothetical protein